MVVRSRGTVLFTLDCEGLWGVADQLSDGDRRRLSGSALEDAHATVLASLERWRIPATFAMVGLFSMTPDEVIASAELVGRAPAVRAWTAPGMREVADGRVAGWCLPGLVDMVRRGDGHEVATHGFSHLPWLGPRVTAADLDVEAEGLRRWSAGVGLDEYSMVFPRNAIGGLELLAGCGVRAFRASPPVDDRRAHVRLRRLSAEVRRPRAEPFPTDVPPTGVVPVPGGVALHWKQGLRRVVPAGLTLRRVAALVDDAAEHGSVAHLWFHPDSLIGLPHQLDLLDRVLELIAAARDGGRVDVLTMRQFAAEAFAATAE